MKTSGYAVLALATGLATLAQGQRPNETEFHALKKLLQSRYGNSCAQRVVGRNTNNPTTQVSCTTPGGTAFMQSVGAPPGPTPQFLKVCSIGAKGKMSCDRVRFRGNPGNDLEKAKELLNGHSPRSFTDFDALVEQLNQAYDNSCVNSTVYGLVSNTTITCTNPGGSATLTVMSPDTYPSQNVPAMLTVCRFGANMQKTCKSINLTGAKFPDLRRTKQLLMSDLSQPSEYQQLVELLYGVYNASNCHTSLIALPPSPTEEYIKCVRPGSNATFSAEQVASQADPSPQSLQVCDLGSFGNARCQNVNFVGKLQKDLNAAKFLLDVDE